MPFMQLTPLNKMPETDKFILIVDDNPTNLSVLSNMLKSDGWSVRVATDGETALQQAAEELPSLILLDIMMPGIGGIETCKRFKDSPRSCEVPVIFMTALTEVPQKVEGLTVGAVDYVTKPFSEQEVLARVRLHSKQSKLLERLYSDRRAMQARLIELMQIQADTDQMVLTKLVEALESTAPVSESTAPVSESTAPVSMDMDVVHSVETYANQLLELVSLYKKGEPQNDLEQIEEICRASCVTLDNWSTPEAVKHQRDIASAWAMIRRGFSYQVESDTSDSLRLVILGAPDLPRLEVDVPKQHPSSKSVQYLLGTEDDSEEYSRSRLIEMCEALLDSDLGEPDAVMSAGRALAMLTIDCRYEVWSGSGQSVVLQIEDPIDDLSFAEVLPLIGD